MTNAIMEYNESEKGGVPELVWRCQRRLLSGYKLKKTSGCSSAEFIEYDLRVFEKGFNFEGEKTGKLMHSYLTVDDIYIDENGNETGDSVDLSPCDYELDKTEYHSLDEYLNVVDEITIDFASEEGYI